MDMAVIRIREVPGSSDGSNDSDGSNSPNAQVSFDHGEEFPAAIQNPFSEAEEERLGWYFEEYLRFPFTRNVLAEEAAKSITAYGHALFEQAFADSQAYTIYDGYRQSGLNNVQGAVRGLPQCQALPLPRISTQPGVAYYHVIHFDLHGALLPYEQVEKLPETNRYQYNDRSGRPDLQAYEGVTAFLSFECEQDDTADLVEASDLAGLLT